MNNKDQQPPNTDKNDAGWQKFKRKILLQSVCLMGISVLIIGAVYLFVWRGNAGDWLVSFFQSFFRMRRYEALRLYNNVFRRNSDVIFFGATAVTFTVLLRFALKRFTRYFDSINNGINALIEGDGNAITLMPEVEAIEKKLNTVRLALERRSKDAQAAEQRKNDLVMYLAHDIKTPLTSVTGYLSLLNENSGLTPLQAGEYTRIALEKAYRLERLIDEFFEITQLNSRETPLSKRPIDLRYMLAQMIGELYPLFSSGGKQALIRVDENFIVYGDPDKLARVFNNILKNAAAYSAEGGVIDITARLSGDTASVAFKNSGGIPEDKLAVIFEKFYRLDDARSSGTGGTGLGLAIAKEIVALHGGRIYAESGGGSTVFTVELPASPGTADGSA